MMMEKRDDLVASIALYNRLPVHMHAYVMPFVPLYITWLSLWLGSRHVESNEFGLLGVAVIGIAQTLTALACVWSVRAASFLMYRKAILLQTADCALVEPQANNGSAEIVTLNRQYTFVGEGKADKLNVWFAFQKVKFTCDLLMTDGIDDVHFARLPFPLHFPLRHYTSSRGFALDDEISEKKKLFGRNRLEMYSPTFRELFVERATAPFFVFQVFCVGLWCLDDYWYYSVFTLFMLVAFEATLVQQQLRNLAEIRKMSSQPYMIQVYRSRRWRQMSTEDLLPGDICSLTRRDQSMAVPADCIVLRGSCIVDESLLTGESVPQQKESIEPLERQSSDADERFDEQQHGRLHIIYGGTRVMQHNGPDKKEGDGIRAPDNGCICYVIRTGFSTNQGSLLRTIMYGVKRVTANNFETFCFILFLLVFAIAAAAYLWIEGSRDEERNRFKLFIECALILTSVVPPELPIELSLAVNSSLMALAKLGVYCTEPFRIPLGGKIDMCCFDKTGTLTSDKLIVHGVGGLGSVREDNAIADNVGAEEELRLRSIKNGSIDIVEDTSRGTWVADDSDLTPVDSVPDVTLQVLVSCHHLVQLEDECVGDPLEKVTLEACAWSVTRQDAVVPKRGKHPAIKILQRFHFSASLKRMSVVASYHESLGGGRAASGSEPVYFIAVKGAPETLRTMFTRESMPTDYDETYLRYATRGGRVLALGRRSLGRGASFSTVRALTREQAECDLDFVGFLVLGCPLRPDSAPSCNELVAASHHVRMITGDNALTACYVARQVGIGFAEQTLIFDPPKSGGGGSPARLLETGAWCDAHGSVRYRTDQLIEQVDGSNRFALCMTGDGIRFLMAGDDATTEKLAKNHRRSDDDRVSTAVAKQEAAVRSELVALLLPRIHVFARVTPSQKEWIINELKRLGYVTLMCGDGTNDVGALKHSECGVALLQKAYVSKAQLKKELSNTPGAAQSTTATNSAAVAPGILRGGLRQRTSKERKRAAEETRSRATAAALPTAAVAQKPTSATSAVGRQAAKARSLEEIMEGMQADEEVPLVKLGDASFAAPFTSKLASVVSVCDIIKQGRCTLVTTLQMFKILALNALILAYSQSVLYLMGVKFSDGQVTLQGLFLAGCFLFISRSKPLAVLSSQRPWPNIFNLYTLATVTCQFAVHFSLLLYMVRRVLDGGYHRVPKRVDLASEFAPDLLNTVVYIMSMTLQVATFLVNYRGRPFMESLRENRPLSASISISLLALAAIASNAVPAELRESLSFVELPADISSELTLGLILDVALSFAIDRVLQALLGEGRVHPIGGKSDIRRARRLIETVRQSQ